MLNVLTIITQTMIMLAAGIGAGMIAARLARRLLPAGGGRWLALAATGTIWLGLITVTGNLLLLAGWFTRLAALALIIGLGAIGVVARFLPAGKFSTTPWPPPAKSMLLLAAILLLPVVARPLLVPMLGWDTVTYHGVRAARYVQTGACAYMPAPGGWGIFQMMPWGGELLPAWTMLFTGNDMFAAAADLVPYLLLGAALLALAGELGLPPALAVVLVLYTMLLPAVRMAVGSGYVDILTATATVLATLWAVRFARQHERGAAFMALLALGLAAGVKASVLPLLVLLTLLLAVLGWRRDGFRATAKWLSAGTASWLFTLGPWLWQNLRVTQLPLGILPVSVGGWTLGRATPAMEWLLQLPEGASYVWQYERAVLGLVFAAPWSVSPHLGWWSVPLLLAGLAGIAALWRRGRAVALVLLLVVLVQVAGFYHPEFSMTRIISSGTAGRFLIALTGILVVVGGFSGIPARWLAGYALAGMLWQYTTSLTYGWGAEEFVDVPVAAAVVAGLLLAVWRLWRGAPRRGMAVLLLFALLLTPVLAWYRDGRRWRHIAASTVLHPVPRYWLPAAQLLDSPGQAHRIAVTSGPEQKADNWFMYYFLGSELQNTLVYISPARSGEVVEYFRAAAPADDLCDSASWQQRLRAEGVTEVLCFRPAARELAWLAAQPEAFTRVAGDGNSWGCYRIK